MISITRISNAMGRLFEAVAKARVNSTLLGMGRERVEEWGYSYEALRIGPSAWPWRKTPQERAKEKVIREHIRELKSFNDRKLNDLGIARNSIEHDVRHGRPGIDFDKEVA